MSETTLYIGIDVETALPSSGICEFAAVGIDGGGTIRFRYASLINPGPITWNDGCIGVHGIHPHEVRGQPDFATAWQGFLDQLDRLSGFDAKLYAHVARFERTAITTDLGATSLPVELRCTRDLARSRIDALDRFGLADVCRYLDVPLHNHHRAEPDATAAAHVARILESRPTVASTGPRHPRRAAWIDNEARGRNGEILANTPRRGNRLAGETIVFTGAFANGLERREAKALAAAEGATPADSVTRNTTILVIAGVGHPIPQAECRSSKAKRAIELGVRMMSEEEFLGIVHHGPA